MYSTYNKVGDGIQRVKIQINWKIFSDNYIQWSHIKLERFMSKCKQLEHIKFL